MTGLIGEIVAFHREGGSIRETLRRTYAALAAYDDPALLISILPEAAAIEMAERLEARRADADLPLLGVPFFVKDNIDVAGLPTTAACPDYAYKPAKSAFVVERLVAAGAIPIGKTNLDQFATGLVGTRSPYGTPRNAIDPRLVPGGSSSGSAVAVGAGIVPFALGTDTAGSGRVPAALNRIVGLKPSLGSLSTGGVVPACRTLDTISIFALTVDDAFTVFDAAAAYDPQDPFSRKLPTGAIGGIASGLRIGVPRAADRLFFGDVLEEAAFERSLTALKAVGAVLVEVDLTPFFDVARLLYDGPWVAERTAAIASFLATHPQSLLPLTRGIIEGGRSISAVATYEAMYRLAALKRESLATWQHVEALAVPTVPTLYTIEQVTVEPLRLNSNLGTYTNFVNLLDLAALAVPVADRDDNWPAGVTLIALAGRDARLAAIGRQLQAEAGACLGATGRTPPPLAPVPMRAPSGMIELAVVGAHMTGLPLNGELLDRGALFLRRSETSRDYRFYALPGGPPQRPGLLRVAAGEGGAIEVEIWALSAEAFGDFVSRIPAPLGVGAVNFADGTSAKCFLCEAEGVRGAADITGHGGWRAYLASKASA